MVTNMQDKFEPAKVWVVRDADGVEVLAAWTKSELKDWFDDMVTDYFLGGTVHEDERFILVMADGTTFEVYDFKNKTAAMRAFRSAVAVFYYGSSDVAAWITPRRVTPEARKAIGDFELVEREWAVYNLDVQVKVYRVADGGGLIEAVKDGALLAEVDLTEDELEEWEELVKTHGWGYDPDGALAGYLDGVAHIYIHADGTGLMEVKAYGALLEEIDLSAEEVKGWLEGIDPDDVEEITEFPEWVTKEDRKAILEALNGNVAREDEKEAVADDAADFDFDVAVDDDGIDNTGGMIEMKEENVERMDGKNIPTFKATKPQEKGARGRFPIHFVGLRYYTVDSFIREAEEIGVSRAIPPRILKTFSWGQPVWLAIHTKKTDEEGNKIPVATVFGFFTIDGINLKAPPSLHAAVENDPRLHIIERKDFSNNPVHESRGCGEYDVVGQSVVMNTLEEVVEVIMDNARKLGVKNYKIMATGRFHRLKPVRLEGVPFTQNITWVDVPDEEGVKLLTTVVPPEYKSRRKSHKVRKVRNYKLRKQYNKRDEVLDDLKKKGWL